MCQNQWKMVKNTQISKINLFFKSSSYDLPFGVCNAKAYCKSLQKPDFSFRILNFRKKYFSISYGELFFKNSAKMAILSQKKISKIQKIIFFSKCVRVDYMIIEGFQSVLGHPKYVFEALWSL